MKFSLKSIKLSDNMANMLRISGGTLAGQLINVINIPLFARMYGDEIIGGWAFLNTVALIIYSVADMGLTEAIMVEKNETDTRQTYRVVTFLVLAAGVISAFCMYLYQLLAPKSGLGIPPLFAAAFLGLAVVLLKQTEVCYIWLNRNGKYSTLMKNPVIQNITFAIVGTILALMGMREYGYYIGWLMGQVITLLHMWRFMPNKFLTFNRSDYKVVLTRNKRNVTFQWPRNVIIRVSEQIPGLLIRRLFGVAALGQYSITMRGLNIPINLLGMAIGRVFFQNASKLKRDGEPVVDFTLRNILSAMRVGVLPIILIMSVGDIAIDIFLGDGWKMAGILIRILAVYAYFLFMYLSIQGLPVVLGKQNISMVYAIIQIITIPTSLFFGYYAFGSLYVGVGYLAATSAISTTVYIAALFHVMNIPAGKYIPKMALQVVLISAGYLLVRFPLLTMGLVQTL